MDPDPNRGQDPDPKRGTFHVAGKYDNRGKEKKNNEYETRSLPDINLTQVTKYCIVSRYKNTYDAT